MSFRKDNCFCKPNLQSQLFIFLHQTLLQEHAQPRTNISAEYWLLGMAYFVMFLYISLSVGRVDLVKSKYGLGIAAVATVFVSLLMSIGLCSVFGVTLTLMPW